MLLWARVHLHITDFLVKIKRLGMNRLCLYQAVQVLELLRIPRVIRMWPL